MGIKLSNNAATILAATVGISDTSVSVSPGAGGAGQAAGQTGTAGAVYINWP